MLDLPDFLLLKPDGLWSPEWAEGHVKLACSVESTARSMQPTTLTQMSATSSNCISFERFECGVLVILRSF